MRSDDLTPEQWRKLETKFAREVLYFERLVARMKETGFPIDDHLFVKADEAYRHLRGLLGEAQARLVADLESGFQFGPRDLEHDRIAERIAPVVARANGSRRAKR